jgi:hypothetical protein
MGMQIDIDNRRGRWRSDRIGLDGSRQEEEDAYRIGNRRVSLAGGRIGSEWIN